MTRARVRIHDSGDNIFADLDLPDADSHYLKAQIVAELHRLANERKLTQTETGARLGISQPEVSRLFRGRFREYSMERLMTFLTAFDRDVEIVARPRVGKSRGGKVTFTAAATSLTPWQVYHLSLRVRTPRGTATRSGRASIRHRSPPPGPRRGRTPACRQRPSSFAASIGR